MSDENLGSMIQSLKGAPMSVFFTMLCLNRRTGRNELIRLTGYSPNSVQKGLAVLAAMGLAENHARANGWSLTPGVRPVFVRGFLGEVHGVNGAEDESRASGRKAPGGGMPDRGEVHGMTVSRDDADAKGRRPPFHEEPRLSEVHGVNGSKDEPRSSGRNAPVGGMPHLSEVHGVNGSKDEPRSSGRNAPVGGMPYLYEIHSMNGSGDEPRASGRKAPGGGMPHPSQVHGMTVSRDDADAKGGKPPVHEKPCPSEVHGVNGAEGEPRADVRETPVAGVLKASEVHGVNDARGLERARGSKPRSDARHVSCCSFSSENLEEKKEPSKKTTTTQPTSDVNPEDAVTARDAESAHAAIRMLLGTGCPARSPARNGARDSVEAAMARGWSGEKVLAAVKGWFAYADSPEGQSILHKGFLTGAKIRQHELPPEAAAPRSPWGKYADLVQRHIEEMTQH